MAKLLSDRAEIRAWTEARSGYPMLEEQPVGTGSRVQLTITFGQHALNADQNEGPDRPFGWELAEWDDWFAELDKQGLIIKVNDDVPGQLDNDFEFVARDGEGQTTDAARQPPAVGTFPNNESGIGGNQGNQ